MPRDLGLRTIVGAGLIGLALGALWAGGMVFALLAATAALLMLVEWFDMAGITRNWRAVALLPVALSVLIAPLYRTSPSSAALLWLALGLAGIALLLTLLSRRPMLGLGILYSGLSGISLVWLRQEPDGFALVLWVFLIVWSTDIFAYASGRTIGGRRLAPRISPNKTWAGLIGGVVAATIIGWLAARWMGVPGHFAPWGGALAVLSQIGDLFESALKRRAGVKDSGSILPGHGGVLDRLDGLVPVAVAVAAVAAITGLHP